MLWGCMRWNGVGKLIEVEGRMDAEQYYEILEDGLVESFETWFVGQHFARQDEAYLFIV